MAAAGITKRWVRGSLLITVLVILAAEVMFLYTDYRELYGGVQRAAESRFSTIAGRLQATGTAGDANETSESRGQALRRTVEQFDEVLGAFGMRGRRVTAEELEFLLFRSVALGMTPPTGLSNVEHGAWDRGDLLALGHHERHGAVAVRERHGRSASASSSALAGRRPACSDVPRPT